MTGASPNRVSLLRKEREHSLNNRVGAAAAAAAAGRSLPVANQ